VEKKVVPQDRGYFCSKCGTVVSNIVRRYILSVRACDHTGSKQLTCFNESATSILGRKADELAELKDGREEEYGKILQDILFAPWEMKIKVQKMFHQATAKDVINYNIVEASKIDFKSHSLFLLEQIRTLETIPARDTVQSSQSLAPVHHYNNDEVLEGMDEY